MQCRQGHTRLPRTLAHGNFHLPIRYVYLTLTLNCHHCLFKCELSYSYYLKYNKPLFKMDTMLKAPFIIKTLQITTQNNKK